LLVWSAAEEGGLDRLARVYEPYFKGLGIKDSDNKQYLQDLAYTLVFRRSSLPWKSFAIANSVDDLQDLKRSFASPVRSSNSLDIAFIFTGQGAQYSQMRIKLLAFPVFANTLCLVDSAFQKLGCMWSLFGKFPCLKSLWVFFVRFSCSKLFASEILTTIR
jgi:acyl transferase domain-containing protein